MKNQSSTCTRYPTSPATQTINMSLLNTFARTHLALPRYATLRTLQTSSVWRNAPTTNEQVDIRARLKDALKLAMKGKDKEAVGTIRVSGEFTLNVYMR